VNITDDPAHVPGEKYKLANEKEITMSTRLVERHSHALPQGSPPLSAPQIQELMPELQGWAREGDELRKTVSFKNYHETMSFVNAVAYIANREDHHPDLEVGYNRCVIRFSTHSVGGLSENDFVCAAKVDQLLK
jgi:4a-hydroxytetrahydrobiopterin dehydratase